MSTLVKIIMVLLVAAALLIAFGGEVGTPELLILAIAVVGAVFLIVRHDRRSSVGAFRGHAD